MNRFPPEPLDADERALAAQLPHLRGRGEPAPALDARILAAAHAAASAPVAARRRRSWVVPLTLTASLGLALGLAWQLQPLDTRPTQHAPAESAMDNVRPPAAIAPAPAVSVVPAPALRVAKPVQPAPAAPQAPAVVLEQPRAVPMPAPMQTATASDNASPPAVAASGALLPPSPPSPPAPEAFPATSAAPPPAALAHTAVEAAAPAKARPVEAMAKQAQDATGDAPAEDIPPATMDSPAARNAWLQRISELLQQGKTEEARASLVEFRRRHPDTTLPDALRVLEPAAAKPASH